MKGKLSQIYINAILILLIVIGINILATKHFVRLDFTKDKQFTLSSATKQIVRNLDEPVTIIAYFSKDLPANLIPLRRQLIDILEDYKAVSKGNVAYKIIDPNKSEELERQALQEGINPLIIEVREKDQAKQQKAYLGLVIKYKDKKEVIPYVAPNSSFEYLITFAIKKLTITEKPKIGILQGFGTPSFNKMQGFINALSLLYEPEPVYIDSTAVDLSQYKVFAVIAPRDSLTDAVFQSLDLYLNNGGNLFLALDAVEGNLQHQPPMGTAINTGIENWLKKYGIDLHQTFITDVRCANIQITQPGFPLPIAIPFPYFPIIVNFQDHPITKGIEAIVMNFASPIEFSGDSTKIEFIPLAFTSKQTGIENPPVIFTVTKNWTEDDFPYQNLIVAAAAKANNWKMVIFGDGDFLQLPAGEQYERSDNVSIAVNSIDWMADDIGLIQLRTKGIAFKPLKELSDTTKTTLKYLNFLLPIILAIIIGIIRMLNNKRKRKLWQN